MYYAEIVNRLWDLEGIFFVQICCLKRQFVSFPGRLLFERVNFLAIFWPFPVRQVPLDKLGQGSGDLQIRLIWPLHRQPFSR